MNLLTIAKNAIYRLLAKRYINGLNPEFDPAKKTILALNHFYDQDLRALSRANTECNLIVVDAPRLARGGKLFFSAPVIHMDAPYTDEAEANRKAWRKECAYIFDLLNDRFDICLIITPSDIFWWIRELIAVARERGVKTVVIDKEGLISPFDFDAEAERIRTRAPFISDHIYVWSGRQRQYWKKIGVTDDRITVLGQPRSDLFHHEHNRQVDSFFDSSQPLITLFSYEETAYIPPHKAAAGLNWKRMKAETHDVVFQLAQKYSQYNFIIKTHPQQSDLAELQTRYRRPNVAVIGGAAVANELIQRSELIIAFQTTGVIEAMFMDKRVVYTCWDETYQKIINDVLQFHNAPGIKKAGSLTGFQAICEKLFSGDTSDFEFSADEIAMRNAFVDTYLYRPDGRVCERFFETIGRFIK